MERKNFVAIDCETYLEKKPWYSWNGEEHRTTRIVSIGICVVRNGERVFSDQWFVKPNKDVLERQVCCEVRPTDFANAESFPVVWDRIKSIIGDLPLYSSSLAERGYFRNEYEAYNLSVDDMPLIEDGTHAPQSLLEIQKGIVNMHRHDACSDAECLAEIIINPDRTIEFNPSSDLIGKKVCIHGIHGKAKDWLTNFLKSNGVACVTGMSRKVDALLCFDHEETQKVIMAKDMGKEIIYPENLLQRIAL